MPANHDTICQEFADRLQAQLVDFDPTIIVVIISVVMELLAKCQEEDPEPTPADVQKRANGIFAQASMTAKLSSHGIARFRAARAARAATKVCTESSAEKIAAMMAASRS